MRRGRESEDVHTAKRDLEEVVGRAGSCSGLYAWTAGLGEDG